MDLYRYAPTMDEISLNKGEQKFVFRYSHGSEDDLLDALIDAAKNPRTDFDWFDAAVLSFRLTPSLIGQADYFLDDTPNNKRPDPTDNKGSDQGDFYK